MDLKIIDELRAALEPNRDINAMWIAGSVAEGYTDEFSDIDVWLDIADGKDRAVFDAVKVFLETKGELDVVFSEGISPPFSHTAYHIDGMDPFHLIEITLHTHSNQFGTFDSLRKIKMIFEKDKVKFEEFNKARYNEMLNERKAFLIEQITFGRQSVLKEIKRQQFPEAMHNYLFWQVEPIVELARIKHAPLKITYGLKQATRDFPEETVNEVESLYQVASLDDLSTKIDQVNSMLEKYT